MIIVDMGDDQQVDPLSFAAQAFYQFFQRAVLGLALAILFQQVSVASTTVDQDIFNGTIGIGETDPDTIAICCW